MSVDHSKSQRAANGDMIDRFLAMSTVWKLGISLALLLLVYLVSDEMIWPRSTQWTLESERVERILDKSKNMDRRINSQLRTIVENLGPIEVPRSPNPGADQLEMTLNEIVSGHPVKGYEFVTRPGARVQASSELTKFAGGGRIERVLAEIEFEADTEDAIALIGEIESEPSIESIGSLRMTVDRDRKSVVVKLQVEAWIKTVSRRRAS